MLRNTRAFYLIPKSNVDLSSGGINSHTVTESFFEYIPLTLDNPAGLSTYPVLYLVSGHF